jgi:hypothetical protein
MVRKQVVEEDNQIYNNAGIEVKPEFQEGWINFMVTYQKIIVRRKKRFER